MSKKKKKVNSTLASDWVYDDLMNYFEFCFGGAHVFRSNKAKKYLFEILTHDSNWTVENVHNKYYVLYHNPVYQPRAKIHVQAKDTNLIWLLWIAYTHDFYKYNKLPFEKGKGKDYWRFIEDFKHYLTYKGLHWTEDDFQ